MKKTKFILGLFAAKMLFSSGLFAMIEYYDENNVKSTPETEKKESKKTFELYKQFPNDCWGVVVSFLETKDVVAFSGVSKELRRVAQEKFLTAARNEIVLDEKQKVELLLIWYIYLDEIENEIKYDKLNYVTKLFISTDVMRQLKDERQKAITSEKYLKKRNIYLCKKDDIKDAMVYFQTKCKRNSTLETIYDGRENDIFKHIVKLLPNVNSLKIVDNVGYVMANNFAFSPFPFVFYDAGLGEIKKVDLLWHLAIKVFWKLDFSKSIIFGSVRKEVRPLYVENIATNVLSIYSAHDFELYSLSILDLELIESFGKVTKKYVFYTHNGNINFDNLNEKDFNIYTKDALIKNCTRAYRSAYDSYEEDRDFLLEKLEKLSKDFTLYVSKDFAALLKKYKVKGDGIFPISGIPTCGNVLPNPGQCTLYDELKEDIDKKVEEELEKELMEELEEESDGEFEEFERGPEEEFERYTEEEFDVEDFEKKWKKSAWQNF